MPVVGAMKKELLGGSYLQADETPVDVQMHDRRGHNHQAYLWQYSRPGGAVVFDFRLGRGREGPKQFLGKYGGILQTDGYVGYEKVGGPTGFRKCGEVESWRSCGYAHCGED
jgi:transposase